MRPLLLIGLFTLSSAPALPAQTPDSLRLYSERVQANPDDSRAVYRLAQLKPRGSAAALALFERYVELEPDDAWGHLALAEAYIAAHRLQAAAQCIERADQLAPGEEDVTIVRQRLARARRSAAPQAQPRLGVTRDSDANSSTQLAFTSDVLIAGSTRLGAAIADIRTDNGFDTQRAYDARLALNIRTPQTRFELAAGAARLRDASDFTTAVARARLRWVPRPDGVLLDLRATRAPVLVSPTLMRNHVILTETRATAEVPLVRALRLRAIGQLGEFRADEVDDAGAATASQNTRSGGGGALVVRTSATTELAGTFYQLSYDAPSHAGYFAPRLVQIIEFGTYSEVYRFDPMTIAFDLGVGAQRIAQHGAATGNWGAAARGWAQVTLPLGSAFELDLEAEAYRSQVNALATSSSWSSVSGMLSLRWLIGL